MNPGGLIKKLNFYAPLEGRDESGAPESSHHDNAEFFCWGRYIGDSHFEIRYRDDFNDNYMVEDASTGKTYLVDDIYDPDGRQRRLHIVHKGARQRGER